MFKKLKESFFYGNIFLGVYAIASCIETSILNNVSTNTTSFYCLIFLATCAYYTMIYVRSTRTKNVDERTNWYIKHLEAIKTGLKICLLLSAILVLFIFANSRVSTGNLIFLIFFPLVAAWYTYPVRILGIKKIRQTGWLKPFIVGFIWAGTVTVYPVIFSNLRSSPVQFFNNYKLILFFLNNLLFFSIIAILFDIKDYQTDFSHRLKTLPVLFGIKKTYSFIIIPLIILNLALFFVWHLQQSFIVVQTLIQLIPFALLIGITLCYRRQRSVLYYLVIVDGLVFVKAICGITSILFIKK